MEPAERTRRERAFDSIIPRLVSGLPAIREWIARTIEAHFDRARSMTTFGFPRLPEVFPAHWIDRLSVIPIERVPILPVAQFGFPELRFFAAVNAGGITFGDVAFVQQAEFERDREIAERLCFHELVHSIQYDELGEPRFIVAYGSGLILDGYDSMALERVPYELERAFHQGADRGVSPEERVDYIRRTAREAWKAIEARLGSSEIPEE